MNHSIYQLKQAWASLSKMKGFLVTVVTTLGITLGALLCILTLAYVLISKPLPYPDQEHLYQVNFALFNDKGEDVAVSHTYPGLVHLFDNQTLFAQSALVKYQEEVLRSHSLQPTLKTTFITPGWFELVDGKMTLGRTFEQTEVKDSHNPVAILSYATWQKEFNGDTNILEQTVTFNDTTFRVVGVMAKEFVEPQLFAMGVNSDVFLPWDYNTTTSRLRESWGMIDGALFFVGKLESQLSKVQVEQTLTTLVNSAWQEQVQSVSFFKGWSSKMELLSFKSAILGESKKTVLLLLVGVIGLVLVACANITNLFMSRTAEQQRQFAIHAAVGASKNHLFQTLFAQSGLLVFISVVVALIFANGGFWVLQHYLAQRLPRVDELAINSVTLGSALFIALALGLFFARLSANMINYRALNATLQSSGKGTGVQVSRKVRQLLIISQVAIVTLLIFVNMGLLRDSLKTIEQPLGFETENITALTLSLNSADDISEEEKKTLVSELRNRLKALPQVEDVSLGATPFDDARVVSQVIEATDERLVMKTKTVDGRYFELIRQPLIEGDFFSTSDLKDENKLLIINEVYAAKLSPQGSALGTKVKVGRELYTVSGVVKGVHMPTETEIPMRAFALTRETDSRFMVKLKPQQTLPRELAVTMAQEVSRQFVIEEQVTLDDRRDQLLFTQYTTAITSSVLAVLTFFLATIGLYGIISYATQMRRFELGTRLAIGAKRSDVIGLIIKNNAGSVAIGIVISLVIMLGLYLGFSDALVSYANTQLIPLFIGTLVLICIMALFACYWPLRPIINARPIHSLRGNQ